jgi:tetratricopeptide (TPR) repeat protein
LNYDVWFDLTRLEENHGTVDSTREAYERAITNLPPISEKKYWRRYIFLWINYAVYEEYNAKNIDRAREIYKKIIEIIPHKKFTFSKVWILYSHFYIRQKNLELARKVFGMSIGVCPREKVFKAYIELELQLGNVDKCRLIYEKFIQTNPDNCNAWVKYAELEKSLEEYERCVAILETAISQPLDMPEIVWKAYINVEIFYKKFNNVRKLYEILLEKTRHVKVWLSYAKFEQEVLEFEKSRDIFERAYNYLKDNKMKEERLMILENWIKTEENNLEKFENGNLFVGNYIENEDEDNDNNYEKNNNNIKMLRGSILDEVALDEKINSFDFEVNIQKTIEVLKSLNKKKPDKIKKRRKIHNSFTKENSNIYNNDINNDDENIDEGWEEYYDYIFPEDEDTKKNFKILGHALKWHKDTNAKETMK